MFKHYMPTTETNEALGNLLRAAGQFATATSMQYKAEQPKDYARLVSEFNNGLAEMVVVVSLSGGLSAQLCADIGTERITILTVPAADTNAAATLN